MSYQHIGLSKVLAVLVCVATAVGCTKDPATYSSVIGFKVADVVTKATIATTDNIGTLYGSFYTDAWVATADKDKTEEAEHYISKDIVSYAETTHKWALSNTYDWLNAVNICFWSWAPTTASTLNVFNANNEGAKDDRLKNQENGELQFSYTVPHSPDAKPNEDAKYQNDILFAYNYQNFDDGSTVSIHFYHALSWIRFMVNKTDGTFDTDLDITSISINNVYSSAHCTFYPAKVGLNEKFTWSFTWTDHNTPDKDSFTQTIDVSEFSAGSKSGEYVSTDAKAFMFIPQTTPDNATVSVTFKRKDNTTITRTVAFNGEVWKAGYYYTYRIVATSLDDPIGFDIEYVDWIDGGTGQI